MACFISKHMPGSFHLHKNIQTEKQQLQSVKSVLSFHHCASYATLRQKRHCCRWWKIWPSSYLKNWSNNWKSDMWWENTTESPEELNTKKAWATTVTKVLAVSKIWEWNLFRLSARWLKIRNIFIEKSWWKVKLYSTEHNKTNMNSRSRYI